MRRGAEALHQAIVDLRRIPYPVIAAVNGPAAGAGFSLALACDTRIASEARLLRLRLRPHRRLAGRRHDLLPAPRRRARAGRWRLLLEDPNMTAEEALAERLVTEVVAPEELMDSAAGQGREAGGQGAPLRADGEKPRPG